MPPNIYEVARKAGVSIATVSRVLNDTGPVSPATRERVLAAMQALGYRPSALGRALAGKRREAIGLVFPDLAGPYHAGVISGIEDLAMREHQALLILGTHAREQAEELVRELASRVDGLVITGRTLSDQAVAELWQEGIRIVLLARPKIGEIPCVQSENVEPARRLAGSLLDHGLQPLFLGDPEASPDVAERWRGFLEAHRERGRSALPPIPTDLRQEGGYRAGLALLRGEPRPRALFCANDETALGVYQAAAQLGLRIPEELAVSGWDDIPQAAYAVPPLTTVRQPIFELGFEAGRMLVELIQGHPVQDLCLPSEVVWRGST
jgi:LacI family transcriptional regulator